MENNCLGSCWGHIYSVSQAGSSHGPGTGCGLGAECLMCWTRHCVQARISAGRMGNSPPLILSASLTGLIYGAASVPDAAQQDAVSGAFKDLGLPNLAVGVCGPLRSSVMVTPRNLKLLTSSTGALSMSMRPPEIHNRLHGMLTVRAQLWSGTIVSDGWSGLCRAVTIHNHVHHSHFIHRFNGDIRAVLGLAVPCILRKQPYLHWTVFI